MKVMSSSEPHGSVGDRVQLQREKRQGRGTRERRDRPVAAGDEQRPLRDETVLKEQPVDIVYSWKIRMNYIHDRSAPSQLAVPYLKQPGCGEKRKRLLSLLAIDVDVPHGPGCNTGPQSHRTPPHEGGRAMFCRQYREYSFNEVDRFRWQSCQYCP